MKTFLPLLAACCLMPSAFAANQSRPTPSPEDRIRKELETTILPKVEFREATLEEAIAILRDQIHRHISRKPELAVQLENHEPEVPAPQPSISREWDHAKITAHFSNIPVSEALRYLTTITSTKVWIRVDGIHIVNVNEPDPLVTKELSIPGALLRSFRRLSPGKEEKLSEAESFRNFLIAKVGGNITVNDKLTRLTVRATEEEIERIQTTLDESRSDSGGAVLGPEAPKVIGKKPDVREKLQSILLPEVRLENVSMSDATVILTRLSARCDRPRPHEELGVEIQLEDEKPPRPDRFHPFYPRQASHDFPAQQKISYSAKNVSLADALQAIANLAKGYITPNNTLVYFTKAPHPYLVVREYRLSPLTIGMLQGQASKAWQAIHDPELAENAKNWMVGSRPMNVSPIREKSAIYVVGDNRYIMNETPEYHEKFEAQVLADWREYYAAEKAKKAER